MNLNEQKKLIIKIGSSLLINESDGSLNKLWLDNLVEEITELKKNNHSVIIVSSGAIGLGRKYLGFDDGYNRLEQQQAAAASGQIILAHAYQDLFEKHQIKVAQVLLTLDDLEDRTKYLNARNTIETLLNIDVIPIINENDTVATEEIRYGDNDQLAARVSQLISADCLILFSDVKGLYDANPKIHPDAQLIKEINNITNEIKSMATESKSDYGSGGMQSKIEAAKICMNSGCHTIVASGLLEKPIDNINNTNDYSHFIPQENPLSARKKWIRGMIDSKGSIEIDQGAEMALETAKSLLPVGVRAVEGSFDKGELISIVSKSGDVIGKGMTNFSDLEIEIIKGLKTSEIKSKLGYLTTNEIIHRDNLVLTK
tara:strand:- start:806 stop:1918 length:1113 start_codon:yes stop_codon:yes gene_type:complete